MSLFVQVTVAGTALGLIGASKVPAATLPPFGIHVKATIVVEAASIRYTVDGSTPTASVGTPALVGDVIELDGPGEITDFRAIRDTSTSSVLNVNVGKG